jgi:hypothetical protein
MKTKLYIGILTLVVLASCKKSENTPDPNQENNHANMIRTEIRSSLIFADDVVSIVYTYNDKNLVTRIDYWLPNDSGSSPTLFTYDGDLVITRDYDNLGNLQSTDTMFLNKQGLVERYKVQDTYNVTYKYDSNGYCIAWNSSYQGNPTQQDTNTITSGNCVYIWDYIPGCGSTANRITFYTDSLNTVTNRSKGQPYLGKSNINPICKNYLLWCTGPIEKESYTYLYDSIGRIIRMDAEIVNSADSYTSSYTYY